MNEPRPDIAPDWYALAFGTLYPVLYAHRTPEAAEREVRFAQQCVNIRPGERVLDVACGGGRHLRFLRGYTADAFGLDYSENLLRECACNGVSRGAAVRADMRAIPFAGVFHAVTNFFTSFGYFQDDAENEAALVEMAGALLPGGRLWIDHVNRDHAAATLVAESQRRAGAYEVREHRWIEGNRVNKEALVARGSEEVARLHESVRLFTLTEMTALFESAGLEVAAVFGDYDGAPLAPDKPRMMLCGRKL